MRIRAHARASRTTRAHTPARSQTSKFGRFWTALAWRRAHAAQGRRAAANACSRVAGTSKRAVVATIICVLAGAAVVGACFVFTAPSPHGSGVPGVFFRLCTVTSPITVDLRLSLVPDAPLLSFGECARALFGSVARRCRCKRLWRGCVV